MNSDSILKIEIDSHGRVCVTPKSVQFPHIYREAMEVGWDAAANCLVAPPDRNRVALATPDWWFTQILAAVMEQGFRLDMTDATSFVNVSNDVRVTLKSASAKAISPEHGPYQRTDDPMEAQNRSLANRAFSEAKHLFHEGNFTEFVRKVREHEAFLADAQKHFLESARKRLET